MRSYLYEAELHLAATHTANLLGLVAMMANNHPRRTQPCVDYLQTLAQIRTSYVHRNADLQPGRDHPFREAELRVLAPEEDTSNYYGRFKPTPLRAATSNERDTNARTDAIEPPPGVDASSFKHLLTRWQDGIANNILAIDRAANNTSVVFELRWRGWRLLFPGDAQQRSWLTMQPHLEPVHFLKVAHHGSSNATPPDSILRLLFPDEPPDRRRRTAVVSTCANTYPGVPDGDTLDRLQQRCDNVISTTAATPGTAVQINFPAPPSRRNNRSATVSALR